MQHTILGACGSIGNALAYQLLLNNEPVRLISRSGSQIAGCESVKADATSYDEVLRAIKGSDVVYLCVGLPYDIRVWKDTWPLIMRTVIHACKESNSKLIFLDNVYMYGKVDGVMTEETPYNPCSKKGEVRAKIAGMLEEEIKQKSITASIARAADFYGPYAAQNSLPYLFIIDKMLKGKKAQCVATDKTDHT